MIDDDVATGAPLHINFSEKEASSEAFDILPRGKYHVKITDVEIAYSKSAKNAGKPYWKVEFTIQDGKYSNRKVWTNVMLFEGALYTLNQLLKSTGVETNAGQVTLPEAEYFIGKDVEVRLTIRPATEEFDERNEVKGISAWKVGAEASSGNSSLMP